MKRNKLTQFKKAYPNALSIGQLRELIANLSDDMYIGTLDHFGYARLYTYSNFYIKSDVKASEYVNGCEQLIDIGKVLLIEQIDIGPEPD